VRRPRGFRQRQGRGHGGLRGGEKQEGQTLENLRHNASM